MLFWTWMKVVSLTKHRNFFFLNSEWGKELREKDQNIKQLRK